MRYDMNADAFRHFYAARLCSKEVRAGAAIEYPVTTTPRGVRDPTDEPSDVVTYVLSRITSDYGSARTSA